MKKFEKKEKNQEILTHKEALKRMKERQKLFSDYLGFCDNPKIKLKEYLEKC